MEQIATIYELVIIASIVIVLRKSYGTEKFLICKYYLCGVGCGI